MTKVCVGVNVYAEPERLHATLSTEASAHPEDVIRKIKDAFAGAGVTFQQLRSLTPSLEDIFIARVRAESETQEPLV